jgi:hypothetical protein
MRQAHHCATLNVTRVKIVPTTYLAIVAAIMDVCRPCQMVIGI